jgi:beta-galactosidase
VVGHVGHGETRVFREVAGLSRDLAALAPVAGTRVTAQAAILYDWEVRWHQDLYKHARNTDKDYSGTCVQHYRPLWRRSIGCDIIGCESSFEGYRLIIAPALYMLRPGQAEQLADFVARGGILLCTAPTGVVNEHDLAFTNGRPGPLHLLFGVWAEEMDVADEGGIEIVPAASDPLGLGRQSGGSICELLHAEDCEVLATYAGTWYAGRPVLTRRRHGKGWAYYLGTRGTPTMLDTLIPRLAADAGIAPVLPDLPNPITAHYRGDHLFLFNWGREERSITLPAPARDLLTETGIVSTVTLPAWGATVMELIL